MFEGLLVLFTFGLLITAFLQWQTSASQTELLRAQMQSSLGAVVRFYISMSNDDIEISAENSGHSIARRVGGHITIERVAFPAKTTIGQPVSYEVTLQDLLPPPAPGEPSLNGTNRDFTIPGYSPADAQAVNEMRQAVFVRGNFTYDDGFGVMHSTEQCRVFMRLPPIPNANGVFNPSAVNDCEQLEAAVSRVTAYQREATK